MEQSLALTCLCAVVVALFAVHATAQTLHVAQNGTDTEISLEGGAVFHTTNAAVSATQLIAVPSSTVLLALWDETLAGASSPYSAISSGSGM